MAVGRQHALIAGLALAAMAAGWGLSQWIRQPGESESGAEQALLSASMTDLNNEPARLQQFRGKVLVINFWATWCPPCRREIPGFVELQAEFAAKGVQFAGIALDSPDQVKRFAAEAEMNYPTYIATAETSTILGKLGNKAAGLPYTLVYDRDGRLREKLLGEVEKTRLQRLISPLI